jgi:hypothetical protein
MASAVLMAGSVSTGGIAAFAVRMVRSKKSDPKNDQNVTERRNDDGNKDSRHGGKYNDQQNRTGDSGAVR